MLIPKTNNDSIEEVDYVDAREGILQKGIKSLVGTLYTYLVLIRRHWVGMYWDSPCEPQVRHRPCA